MGYLEVMIRILSLLSYQKHVCFRTGIKLAVLAIFLMTQFQRCRFKVYQKTTTYIVYWQTYLEQKKYVKYGERKRAGREMRNIFYTK